MAVRRWSYTTPRKAGASHQGLAKCIRAQALSPNVRAPGAKCRHAVLHRCSTANSGSQSVRDADHLNAGVPT